MKTAIYARKSTDDSDRSPDNKSVARQVERAKAYAAARGWSVSEEHVYVDDGISGAEFRNRPALLRLLNHLRPLDMIVMSELSRLGREMTQTATVLGQIRAAGVRVCFYLTDEELRFDTAIDKFMVSAVAFGAELEREKASQRSRDALLRKAERGYNTGGRVYGYANVPVYAASQDGQLVKSHTDYRIDSAEAEVVRTIFSLYAEGHGMRAIARTLNGDPAYVELAARYFALGLPSSPRTGACSWAPSSIREMLHRVRYLGKVPFGEYRKVLRAGSSRREKQERYQLTDRADLQIVPQGLWDRAHARLQVTRQAYLAATRGEHHGRPDTNRASRYLLSGLMRCGCCSGSMVASSVALGSGVTRRREPHYLCSYRHNRGSTVCANARRVRAAEVDERLLNAIERTILTPGAVDYVVDRVIESVLASRRTGPERVKEIDSDLRRLRRELDRFVSLIANAKAPDRVLEEIACREQQIKTLENGRAQLQIAPPTRLDVAHIRELALARARELRSTLNADIAGARQALRQLLVGPITFKLLGPEYRLEAQTRVGPLFAPTFPPTRIRLATPRGFEPRLPP